MRPTRSLLELALLVMLATGVAVGISEPAGAATVDTHPIVKVVTRSGTVTIRITEAGPIYTIRGKDGKLVAENLSEMELKIKHPDLYELIMPAVATSSAFPYTIDASLGDY